jgi:hypothetical protein
VDKPLNVLQASTPSALVQIDQKITGWLRVTLAALHIDICPIGRYGGCKTTPLAELVKIPSLSTPVPWIGLE